MKRTLSTTIVVSSLLWAACGVPIPGLTKKEPMTAKAEAEVPAADTKKKHVHHDSGPRREMPEGAGAPLFHDLGKHHYPISTKSKAAQRYFDQALILTYGFNHAEAIRSYREAQRLDPECVMCFWGEAFALGPNINKPMDDKDVPAAWQAAQKALSLTEHGTPRERAMVQAIAKRYAEKPVKDRAKLDRAFADAMAKVAAAYPEDLDIRTVYVESVMDTMPWNYYRTDGKPKPETDVIIAQLEGILTEHPEHPGAIHLYIHAIEPSPRPERAEAPADRLRDLVPGAGHLVHMPSHIYLRIGRYADASLANEKAAAADESYISQCRAQGFYPAAYYSHNIHFLWASAAFEGRKKVSIDSAKKLVANIPEHFVDEVPLVEEFLPTYLVGLARFGEWDAILAEPEPLEKRRYLTGMWHFARGMARAGKGELAEAKQEREGVEKMRGEWKKSDLVFLSGSTPEQLLRLASLVLEARIAGASGDWKAAVPLLKNAVKLQDSLVYTEPPPFYFPIREALGHALLESGQPAEAEKIYRQQLARMPRNGWSLFGLAESLRAQKKEDAALDVERRFTAAWQQADIELTASVF